MIQLALKVHQAWLTDKPNSFGLEDFQIKWEKKRKVSYTSKEAVAQTQAIWFIATGYNPNGPTEGRDASSNAGKTEP